MSEIFSFPKEFYFGESQGQPEKFYFHKRSDLCKYYFYLNLNHRINCNKQRGTEFFLISFREIDIHFTFQ